MLKIKELLKNESAEGKNDQTSQLIMVIKEMLKQEILDEQNFEKNKNESDQGENNNENDQDENNSQETEVEQQNENTESENYNASDYNSMNSTQFLSVVGRASGKMNQNIKAQLGISIESVDYSASVVSEGNTKILNPLKDVLMNFGVEEFEITNQQIIPILVRSETSDETQYAFRAVTSLNILTKSELLGHVTDNTLKNGVKQIDYISLLASNEDLEAFKQNLIEEAIKDSKKKARIAINTLGYELGPIMNIEYLNENKFDLETINKQYNSNGNLPEFVQRVEVKYGIRIKQEKIETKNI